MNSKQREEALTLELLEAIEQRSDVTQRHLAGRMGVALGLANSYLKRCARKGLIKVQQAPANRYLYYLTPKGFAEKSRLTAEYLSVSLGFYRRASESCADILAECRRRGVRTIGLFGASDLAEIAAVKAIEDGLEIACLCDPSRTRRRFLSYPVVHFIGQAPPLDAWLFTALEDARELYAELKRGEGPERVFAPSILRLEDGGRD